MLYDNLRNARRAGPLGAAHVRGVPLLPALHAEAGAGADVPAVARLPAVEARRPPALPRGRAPPATAPRGQAPGQDDAAGPGRGSDCNGI